MGGAQRYVFDLATNLPKDQFEVVVAAGGNGSLFKNLTQANIKTIKLNHLIRPINALKEVQALFELRKVIKHEQPHIVHLNSSKAGVIGSVAAKSIDRNIKVVYTAHGWVFNEPLNKVKKKFYQISERATAKFKDVIICVSQFDYNSALEKKIVTENQMGVVRNGLSFDKNLLLSKREARSRLDLPQDKIIIGSIGYLYPNKGFEFLIESLKNIADEILLVIIGNGRQASELNKKIGQMKLRDRVKIITNQRTPVKVLKAFDIYVCSSIKEGFPYSVLEAMSAGLPIVSTNVGGLPEMLDENSGILVEPKNSQALAKSISALLNDKQKALALGANATKRVGVKFTLEKMLTETLSYY